MTEQITCNPNSQALIGVAEVRAKASLRAHAPGVTARQTDRTGHVMMMMTRGGVVLAWAPVEHDVLQRRGLVKINVFKNSVCMLVTTWRNGSAFDSRSRGCEFDSCRGQRCFLSMKCVIFG